ncbi:MAG: hypothetical protein ABIF11_04860 [Nitrospirota bacterium]
MNPPAEQAHLVAVYYEHKYGGIVEMLKKMLAFVSMICPVCNLARRFPESKFAGMIEKERKNCPACKAYKELCCKKGSSQA